MPDRPARRWPCPARRQPRHRQDSAGTRHRELDQRVVQAHPVHARLLPSDVVGITFYDQKHGEFEFREGPVFASIVLADEINRASPKTQSALLEVMEEQKVTVDGAHTTCRSRSS